MNFEANNYSTFVREETRNKNYRLVEITFFSPTFRGRATRSKYKIRNKIRNLRNHAKYSKSRERDCTENRYFPLRNRKTITNLQGTRQQGVQLCQVSNRIDLSVRQLAGKLHCAKYKRKNPKKSRPSNERYNEFSIFEPFVYSKYSFNKLTFSSWTILIVILKRMMLQLKRHIRKKRKKQDYLIEFENLNNLKFFFNFIIAFFFNRKMKFWQFLILVHFSFSFRVYEEIKIQKRSKYFIKLGRKREKFKNFVHPTYISAYLKFQDSGFCLRNESSRWL